MCSPSVVQPLLAPPDPTLGAQAAVQDQIRRSDYRVAGSKGTEAMAAAKSGKNPLAVGSTPSASPTAGGYNGLQIQ